MKTYTEEELRAEVAKHRWWHRIDLGHGIVTPGECGHGATEAELTERWGLPEKMAGLQVLDIGCYDGLFSAACLRRGAAEATGLDVVPRATYRLVANALGHGANHRMKLLMADAQQAWFAEAFDVVLCLGVIYHVERPLEVIRNAVRASKGLVIIETALAEQVEDEAPQVEAVLVEAGGQKQKPNIRWVQDRGHGGDPTNIWYPTAGAVIDALKAFGCFEAYQHYHLTGGGRATFVGRK